MAKNERKVLVSLRGRALDHVSLKNVSISWKLWHGGERALYWQSGDLGVILTAIMSCEASANGKAQWMVARIICIQLSVTL